MFGPVAAWQVGEILAQNPAPQGARQQALAIRPALHMGIAMRWRWAMTVPMSARSGWGGRTAPVPGAFGGDLAAPVLFDLFDALPVTALPPAPPQTLIVPNSALPLPLRRFAAPGEVSAVAASPASPDALRLTYPPDGAEIDADGPLIAKGAAGADPGPSHERHAHRHRPAPTRGQPAPSGRGLCPA